MNIRKKAAAVVGIMLVFLIIILYSVTEKIVSNRFSEIEKYDLQGSLTRVNDEVNSKVSEIDSINRVLSSLDETSSFITNHNEYYIEKNLNDLVFENLKLNFAVFINMDQNVIFSKGYDFTRRARIRVPESLLNEALKDPYINTQKGMQSSLGIINLPEGAVLVSSEPILNFGKNGAIQGRIILGRYIDDALINQISDETGFKVALRQFNDDNPDNEFKNAKQMLEKSGQMYVQPVNQNSIEGYALIKDISGKPAVIARVTKQRNIYMAGDTSRGILSMSIFGMSLVFGIIILVLLEKEVIGPSKQRGALINSIPSLIYFKDNELRYIAANKAYCSKYNIAEKEIKGKTIFDFKDFAEAERINTEEIGVIETGIPIMGKVQKLIDKYGKEVWYSTSKTPYFDNNGNVKGIVGVTSDITEIKEMRDKLQHLAYYDQLTGLPNKTYFTKYLEDALNSEKYKNSKMGILFIDLDQFKLVNDTLGHATGDTFLSDVAEKFRKCIDGKSVISRFGGDEFAVLVPEIEDISELEMLARNLLELISKPWEYGGQVFYITTSIGIAVYPKDGGSSKELLKNADAAMYYAKKHGKDSYKFYNESLSTRVLEQIQLKNDLINALEKGEFELYYQPQINARYGKVMGVEALVRWNKPGVGIIPPDKFINFAESSGLIVPIGEAVLKMACKQVIKWQEEGLPPIRVAVNVSTRQFENHNFAETVRRTLNETGMNADLLEIEITETDMMKYPENAISLLKTIRDMGVKISVDDFGTGYSSLMYLKRLPIDRIKIDRSFVQDISKEASNTAIVRTIIGLSKNMGLDLIAEGVETEEQLKFLKDEECDEIQGYIYSRPLPAGDAKKWLENYSNLISTV